MKTSRGVLLIVCLLHGASAPAFCARTSDWVLDREPLPGEVQYAPADHSQAKSNPPTFVWLPVADADRYVLQLSRSGNFEPQQTIERRTVHCIDLPRQPLEAGTWFWRYGIIRRNHTQPTFGKTRSFEITPDSIPNPFPDVHRVIKRLSTMRPRIGLRPGDLETFRKQSRGELASAVKPLLRSAESHLGKPLMDEPGALLPRGDAGRNMSINRDYLALRELTDRLDHCAEAYLLTGDGRFGAEARRILMHFMSWDPDGSTSLASYDAFATHLVRSSSRAYDYVFSLLSAADRDRCRKVLATRMNELYRALREIPFEARPYRSHAMGFWVPDLTEACVAMAGEIPVDEHLEYCLLQFWSPYYPPFGGEDGGWAEGPYYWDWYWPVYARICAVVERATEASLASRALTHHAPLYKIYTNPPWSKMSPFGDGQSYPAGGAESMFILGSWLQDPHALWYADQFHVQLRGLPAFLFNPGQLKPAPPDNLPLARCFYDVGLVAMRSDLTNAARDVQVLLRSSPYGSVSHGYADQNAFTLDVFGEPIAIQSGYYDLSNSPHQRNWTRLTKAANSITVDGQGQRTNDSSARGRIAAFVANDYAFYARGDAGSAYDSQLQQFDRHVLYVRPQSDDPAMIIMVDNLRVPQASRFEWHLHALGPMEVAQARPSVTIRGNSAAARVEFLAPADLELTQTNKFPAAPNNSNLNNLYPDQWHLTAQVQSPRSEAQFVTALIPFRTEQEGRAATVRRLQADRCLALEVKTEHARHVILVRAPGMPGMMKADGRQSAADLYAAGVSEDGTSLGTVEFSTAK